MPTLEFGWFLSAGPAEADRAVPEVVAEAAAVLPLVAAYFDSIWVPDHFYAFDDPAHAWVECWTTLTWLAARYPRLRLGPIVLGVGYRHPALLAKMAATLQTLSGGRFVMGIGAGWREAEYHAYGYPFPPARERIAQLDEAVQIMRLMWTSPAPSFAGRHFQIREAYCEPRPTPLPPIMIGGSGPKLVLPLVGRLADIWDRYHGGSPAEIDLAAYREKRDLVHEHAVAAGRDPAAIVQSYSIEDATLPATDGEAAMWREQLQALREEGVRQVLLGFRPVPGPEPVERFVEEVMRPLREP